MFFFLIEFMVFFFIDNLKFPDMLKIIWVGSGTGTTRVSLAKFKNLKMTLNKKIKELILALGMFYFQLLEQ